MEEIEKLKIEMSARGFSPKTKKSYMRIFEDFKKFILITSIKFSRF